MTILQVDAEETPRAPRTLHPHQGSLGLSSDKLRDEAGCGSLHELPIIPHRALSPTKAIRAWTVMRDASTHSRKNRIRVQSLTPVPKGL